MLLRALQCDKGQDGATNLEHARHPRDAALLHVPLPRWPSAAFLPPDAEGTCEPYRFKAGAGCLRVDATAVSLDDVKKVAYDHVHDCDHALAARGPVHELPDYNWVRTASYDYAV